MSQENVEIVRRMFDAWATGDLRAGVEVLDQHVVFIVTPGFPAFGVHHGPDGVRPWAPR